MCTSNIALYQHIMTYKVFKKKINGILLVALTTLHKAKDAITPLYHWRERVYYKTCFTPKLFFLIQPSSESESNLMELPGEEMDNKKHKSGR